MRSISKEDFKPMLIRHRIGTTILLLSLFILFCSFTSAEKDGKYTAEMVNKCYSVCIDDVRSCENYFIKNFNKNNYKTRKAAKQAYFQYRNKVFTQFSKNLSSVKEYYHKMEVKYEKNEKNWNLFRQSYNSTIDKHLQQRVNELKQSTSLPPSVQQKILTIIPSKPSVSQMKVDLNGQSLSEGVDAEDSWFNENWRLTIKSKQIQDFKVVRVLSNTSTDYRVLVSMKIVTDINSFNVNAIMHYVLPSGGDWKLEYVLSQGVRLIETHRYDKCISCSIVDDGWGGVDALYIQNKVNMELAVGGKIYANGKWQKFAVRVGPNASVQVGGTFGGGSVTSYKIEIVERLQ